MAALSRFARGVHEEPVDRPPIQPGVPVRWLACWRNDGRWHTAVFDDHARADGYAARNHGEVYPLVVPEWAFKPQV